MPDLIVPEDHASHEALQTYVGNVLEEFIQALAPAMRKAKLSPDDFRKGMVQIQVRALELAAQAHRATVDGVPFKQAVHDFDTYPLLSMVYHSAHDIVKDDLPPDMRRFLMQYMKDIPHGVIEATRRSLAVAALQHKDNLVGSFGRFLFFLATRFNLTLAYHPCHHDSVAIGFDDELDEQAERSMTDFFAQTDLLDQPVRPLHMMVGTACQRALPLIDDLTDQYMALEKRVLDIQQVRAGIEERIANMDAATGLIVRKMVNDWDEDNLLELFGGDDQPRMTFQRLRAMHPAVLGHLSDDALNMRAYRIRTKIQEGEEDSLQRKGVALIDLLLEEADQDGEDK